MAFKISDSHWQIICSFMETHIDFACGKFVGPQGKAAHRKLWEILSQQLNALGLGNRTVEKWQKTWADTKYLIKKKATAQRCELQMTGGGKPKSIHFTPFEERILAVLGSSFHEGVGSKECGVPQREMPLVREPFELVETATSYNKAEIPALSPLPDIQVHKQVSTSSANAVEDHDYCPKAKKKKRQYDKENELYQETIDELKLIRQELNGVNQNLQSMNDTFRHIRDILLKK